MTEPNGSPSRKQLAVFTIIERKDSTKPPYWMRIGTAFPNRDGSITIYLDAFPIGSNKLQVREPRPWDDGRAPPRRDSAEGQAQP